ncbi:MAG: type I-C CRISPR-associated protein Cas8c/Csd1 [Thermomicrobiales bacterium]|jgi:CRISPR-associated protein Csd1
MLLQALRDYSTRLDDLGPPMYKRTPIKYEVQLDVEGNPIGLVTLTGGEELRADRGLPMLVPLLVRTSGIKPILLADRGDYALGWGDGPRTAQAHRGFIDLVSECADTTGERDVFAVVHYLAQPDELRIPMPADADPQANVTFSVEGRWPIDSPAVRAFWAMKADRSASAGDGETMMECIVCGERRPPLRRMPIMIKGLGPVGGQSSGAALVSANVDVFESFHLKNNHIAPMCSDCAERVSKALNALIEDESSRLYLGRVLYVFWTREPTSFAWGTLLSRADPGQVEALLTAAYRGRSGAMTLDATAFYCVGLSGSGGRVAVRGWIDTTVSEASQNLARYFALQRLVDIRSSDQRYFGIRSLADATIREGSKDPPLPDVPQALMRLALRGGALPMSLVAQVIRRIRAGQVVNYQQAALIKMVLASQQSEGWETFMVGLDEQNRDPAYLCGRLLAVLDVIQREALGERNATIIDRFFGSASTAPLSVFGRLTRGAQPHLARLRRDKPGAYIALERRMQDILAGIGAFPRTLSLREQGVFVLGYYHQRAADAEGRRQGAAARRANDSTPENEG